MKLSGAPTRFAATFKRLYRRLIIDLVFKFLQHYTAKNGRAKRRQYRSGIDLLCDFKQWELNDVFFHFTL
jgi:hypothetical protein